MKKESAIIEEIGRELMKRPIRSNPYTFDQPIFPTVDLPIGKDRSLTPSEILCRIKRENAKKEEVDKEELAKKLGEDNLFRFGYVPFVISELAWDYADTVIDLAIIMKLNKVKPLCRAIKALRTDYLRLHNAHVDKEHYESEKDNMIVFEEGVKQVFDLYIVNLKCDLASEHPELSSERIAFLTAIYQCWIVVKSLLLYASRQADKVAKIVGHPIGNIIPWQVRKLGGLIIEFAKDSPVSKRFDQLQKTYIETLATQIALVELTPIKEETNRIS